MYAEVYTAGMIVLLMSAVMSVSHLRHADKQDKSSVMGISDVLTSVVLQSSSSLHSAHVANDVFCHSTELVFSNDCRRSGV